MSSTKNAWGFSEALTVNVDITAFLKSVNEAALDRGIKPNEPSDALDMSRDVILTEAAQKHDAEWDIVGDTLRVWPSGVTVKWEEQA